MRTNRRSFITSAALAGSMPFYMLSESCTRDLPPANKALFDDILSRPILKIDDLTQAVVIKSMVLLRNGKHIMVRVRSNDGAEGIVVSNSHWMFDLYPIFNHRVAAFLIGKDARKIETLIEDILQPDITYKLQGLALWVCVAAAEMAILDMLGKITDKSIGKLFGGVRNNTINVYRASGRRGNTPEEEIEFLQLLLEETGGSAIKFRVGGQLSNNRDSLPGRSEALIPMVRKVFGDEMTIYADSNSSYDVPNAIRIGRLMEEQKFAFFEEPCRFDNLWETKQVADALDIPIAGGEQESSLIRFQWTIQNKGLDVVQPDLHYFGGLIRSYRVALMAEAAGIPCTPHMSGWEGLGFLDALHFMSFIPNPSAHMEFKGYSTVPLECSTSSLRCKKGQMDVPSGPGFGIEIDPDFIQRAEIL